MLNRMGIVWSPPLKYWMKCNFDSFSKGNTDQVGAGGLVRNQTSDYILAFGVNLGIFSNNKAKAMAALGAFNFLKELGFSNVIIEGDSKLIVDILNDVVAPPWEIKNIIDRCKLIKISFTICGVQHVYKEGNRVVDCATNVALGCRGWTRWTNGNMPPPLKDVTTNEKFENEYQL